ncbi:MAG: hypothetical protein IPO27_16770 [Bacteroidetes bacterium]|nr:hypothetical protein [Bacteroidota bacterium]
MKKEMMRILMLTMIAALVITGCKKDNDNDTETESSSDNAIAEAQFDNVARQVGDVADANKWLDFWNGGIHVQLNGCANISVVPADTITWPKTVTIDFGPVNCTGWDGKMHRGKIIAVFTGRYRNPGTVISISFDNYFVNNNKIEGTKTITNNGFNNSNHLSYSIVVSNGKITKPDGSTLTWNSTRTREWISGYSTQGNHKDDEYLISGSASGTSFKGISFAANITQPLLVSPSCKWIMSGIVELTPQGKPTRTINFGSGNCDDQATITIKNKTFTITLK